jgi:segregation and condensation protein B
MSLKPKLEAVIYAAEEPVTLGQLAAIFADEVLPGLEAAAEQGPEQIELVGLSPESGIVPENASSTPEDAPVVEGTPVVSETTEVADEKKAARLRDRQVRQVLQGVLDELMADYTNSERGMEIREIAGGYRMATKPEYHDAVRGFVKSLKPPMKLSLQALETLAVIAYKQPVTAPEVSEIRGVDSGGVLGSLVGRKLITTAGRKPVIGRPILYKTTKEFLLRFGLKDVNDLPSMEEFEKMAGELAETEAKGEAQDEAVLRSSDPESEGETSPEAQTELQAESQAEPEVESQTEPQAESQPEPEAESQTGPEAELQTEPHTDPEAESHTEPETEPHHD